MSIHLPPDHPHAQALAWASTDLDVQALEPVSHNAWACTYRLVGASENRYLKVLPQPAQDKVSRVALIAKKLRGQVPAVLRAAPDQGWLLFAEVQGQGIARDEDHEAMAVVARDFGRLQAKAAGAQKLLNALPAFELGTVRAQLLDFLQAQAPAWIGPAAAARHRSLLLPRLPLLDDAFQAAAALPTTLCHGDMSAGNVLLRPRGKTVFFDWDDASAGPAGLCLHGLFASCALPAVLLKRWAQQGSAGESPQALRLQAYLQALVSGGYASPAALAAGLVGSMAAGQMAFIISFGHYAHTVPTAPTTPTTPTTPITPTTPAAPPQQADPAAADTLLSRLGDLLNLCDWLSCQHPETARRFAADYESQGEWHRASGLVQDLLSRAPQDTALLTRYARLAYQQGDVNTANDAAQEARAQAPADADVLLVSAQVALGQLNLDHSAALLGRVLEQRPGDPRGQALAGRVQRAVSALQQAEQPDQLPRVALSADEQAAGRLEPDTLALMVSLFKRHGALQLDNLFAPDYVAGLQRSFAERYGQYFHDGERPDVLKVGDKRYMLTMALDDVFGAQPLVANSLVLPFMQGILGENCILGAYTAVISLPGSEPQTLHKDHSELFEEHGWLLEHPSFAAQIIVPLLQLDEVTGATRVHKGTQRVPLNRSGQGPYQDPVVPLGSAFFLDYSVAHYGMGNRSDQVRPILNLIYCRPWFRDIRNYHLQPPLRISDAFLQSAPESTRELIDWWVTERKAVLASSDVKL